MSEIFCAYICPLLTQINSVLALLSFLWFQNHASVLVNGTCQIPDPVYKLVGSIVCFYIPLGVMLLTYCLTVRLLARQRQNLGGGQQTAAATPGWASGWLGQAPALGKDARHHTSDPHSHPEVSTKSCCFCCSLIWFSVCLKFAFCSPDCTFCTENFTRHSTKVESRKWADQDQQGESAQKWGGVTTLDKQCRDMCRILPESVSLGFLEPKVRLSRSNAHKIDIVVDIEPDGMGRGGGGPTPQDNHPFHPLAHTTLQIGWKSSPYV